MTNLNIDIQRAEEFRRNVDHLPREQQDTELEFFKTLISESQNPEVLHRIVQLAISIYAGYRLELNEYQICGFSMRKQLFESLFARLEKRETSLITSLLWPIFLSRAFLNQTHRTQFENFIRSLTPQPGWPNGTIADMKNALDFRLIDF